MDLSPYIVQEGNAYRVLPIRNPKPRKELVNTEVAYENMVKKFQYRELDNPKVYYTNDYRGFVLNHRSALNALAEALIGEGKMEKARESILLSVTKMPDAAVRMDPSYVGIGEDQGTIELLFRVGEKEKAVELSKILGDRSIEVTNYFVSKNQGYTDENRRYIYMLAELQNILYRYGEEELAKKYEEAYEAILKNLQVQDELSPDGR
jgi:tetratricopeptide (TPR) repeat protein